MNRAYSVLTVKSVKDDQRIIAGTATSPTPDRMGDIVEPLGVKFKNPLPLLHHHKSDQPVGTVRFNKPTKDGITFEARLPKIEEDGPLKQRVDTAWQEIKSGLIRGVSIGFRALESSTLEDGGIRFIESEVLELSLVAIPAQQEATITAIKSFDETARAALGNSGHSSKSAPGVSGQSISNSQTKGTQSMETIEQRIDALENERGEKVARMKELYVDGKFANDEDKTEYRTIAGELKGLDENLSDLKAMHQAIVGAKPVDGSSVKDAGASRGGAYVKKSGTVDKDAEPGIRLARMVKVKALAYLEGITVNDAAKASYAPNKAEMILTDIKAAAEVGAHHTTTPAWGGALVGDEASAFADFAEFLRPQTILGKFGTNGIPALRRVPFRTRLVSQETGGAGYWVSEGRGKPLTHFEFASTTLEPTKCASIAVATEELVRDSSPSAEMILRDQLAQALVAVQDLAFISSSAASAPVPGGILASPVTGITSEGPLAEDVRVDVRRIMEAFSDANNPPTSGVWIMRPDTALAAGLMVNELGVTPQGFGNINMNGGTFFGVPVITSNHVTANTVILVNASDIYFADEGGIRVDVSREASLEMVDNADTGTLGTSTNLASPPNPNPVSMVSMWQTNSVAFRAERTVNWSRRRNSGVKYLSDVQWGYSGSPLS